MLKQQKKLKRNAKNISCQNSLTTIGKDTNAGITLVALVITIVVLLILAGVTIMYVLGDNSVFNQATKSKVQTELAKIEEKAGLIYSDKLIENTKNTGNTEVETSQVIEELRNGGDQIAQRPVEAKDITGISLDKESMTIGKNKTGKIKIRYEGIEDIYIYYAEVEGKYYRIHSNRGLITIDREPSNLTASDFETGGRVRRNYIQYNNNK